MSALLFALRALHPRGKLLADLNVASRNTIVHFKYSLLIINLAQLQLKQEIKHGTTK
jgi:hypothetical protein